MTYENIQKVFAIAKKQINATNKKKELFFDCFNVTI